MYICRMQQGDIERHSYPWSVTTQSHIRSYSCTAVKSIHNLGQSLHLLILYPVTALLSGISFVSHAPSHTLSCFCTAARYTHLLHLLILYPIPGLTIQLFIGLLEIFLSPASTKSFVSIPLQPDDMVDSVSN